MRSLSFTLIVIIFIAACSKEHNNHTSLLGIWVEKNFRLDTLVVTQSGNKIIMFDNSTHYRTTGRVLSSHDRYFRHHVILKKDSIGFRAADAARTEPFFYYSFQWIVFKKEFTMSYNG